MINFTVEYSDLSSKFAPDAKPLRSHPGRSSKVKTDNLNMEQARSEPQPLRG